MLCVAHSNDFGREPLKQKNTMPVDYTSYLLSASPPGFDVAYALRDQFGIEDPRKHRARRNPYSPVSIGMHDVKESRPTRSRSQTNFSRAQDDINEVTEGFASLLVEEFQSARSNSLPIQCRRSQSDFTINQNKNKNNNTDNGLKKKSVSFADDLGKSLVEVRLLHDGPDVPPTLCPQMLSSLAQGAQAAVTDAPPLLLNFTQPASNYVAFREKIEKNCVSLENVIVKEYKLIGTVKVKNIAFEKNVVIRYTCDSWATHQDLTATYVPLQTSSCAFDTFSFQLSIPPAFDPQKKILFAIVYDANGQEFWDSNDGNNYEVVSASHRPEKGKTADNGVFDLNHDDRWTEFSNWNAVDNSIPYY